MVSPAVSRCHWVEDVQEAVVGRAPVVCQPTRKPPCPLQRSDVKVNFQLKF